MLMKAYSHFPQCQALLSAPCFRTPSGVHLPLTGMAIHGNATEEKKGKVQGAEGGALVPFRASMERIRIEG